MRDQTPVSKYLEGKGIPHRQFTHPGPITSLEQAARERNQDVGQIVRSILFRLRVGEYVMVLIAGPKQISWQALRKHFQQSRLTIASPDEVKQVTGYEIGAVSPFGLPNPIPILVDESVLDQPAVSIGSGVVGTTILMTTPNLVEALGEVETGKFAIH
jgi:Cys-tRNA(Pro) deacylase